MQRPPARVANRREIEKKTAHVIRMKMAQGRRVRTELDHRGLVVDREAAFNRRLERLDVVAQHRQTDSMKGPDADGRRVLRVDFLF